MVHSLALTVLLTMFSQSSVQGAICTTVTSTICEATDYTFASCDSSTNICGCKPGYIPIRTGCGRRLPTPIITLPSGRTPEIIIGTNGHLECTLPTTQYNLREWKLDGTEISGARFNAYYITAANDSDAGRYSCIAKYQESVAVVLDSEESETVEITLVTETVKSRSVPQVSGIPEKAADGALLTPGCANIPIGAKYSYVVDDGQEVTDIRAEGSGLTYNSTLHKNIKCVLDVSEGNFFTTTESPTLKMPAIASDIDSVTLTSDAVGSEYVVKTGSYAYMSCILSPEKKNMITIGNYRFQFTFLNSVAHTIETIYDGFRYSFYGLEPITHHVFCTASYKENEPKQSGNVTVRFSDDYIKNATLIASGTLLLPRSRLVLTCGASQDGVTYKWFKSRMLMHASEDRILQIDNFTSSDAAMYECEATINNYETKSLVIVQETDALDQPVIESADLIGGTTLGADGDFMLVCLTASATAGMKYSWRRNGTDLTNPSRIYMVRGASARKHNGEYMCTASFLDQEDKSPSLYLTIVSAGKVCTPANVTTECSGEGYKEICDDEGRCECDTGWYKKGHGCAKSSTTTTVVSSALQVLVVITLSALF